ncbi:hypothetical protein BDV95DRAFT_606274 [Massariosphaeria phaeospora]|uniref:Uncharacterized protein n=1 Tax=Massariosphaeria phaeospora TaxID=100035 RepID=A0A7C8IGZ9_9PLEO|nr:hypothetical protein BDV95DRAFT_606274 [Massariosphaeria phaeospora]
MEAMLSDGSEKKSHRNSQPYATLFTVTEANRNIQDFDSAELCTEALERSLRSDQSSILFLRGYPSAKWLATIGAVGNIDPGFFNLHFRFRSRANFFSLPSLPTPSCLNTTISLMTISALDSGSSGAGRSQTQATLKERMRQHREHLRSDVGLSVGDAIIRECFAFDGLYIITRQEISITLFRSDSNWAALVCCDTGNYEPDRYLNDTADPFLASYINATPFPLPENRKGDWPQYYKPLIPSNYGEGLEPALIKKSPWHGLLQIYELALFSQVQFLNLAESKLEELRVSMFEGDSDLGSTKEILYVGGLAKHLQSELGNAAFVIKNKEQTAWYSDAKLSITEKETVENLAKDIAYLETRSALLAERCQAFADMSINMATITESRKALEQAETLRRLTLLATFFIPISLTASLFGMNFTELPQYRHRRITIFLVLVPILLTIALMLPKSFMRRLRYVTASLFTPELIIGRPCTPPVVRRGFVRVNWTCECGDELYTDFPQTKYVEIDRFCQSLGISRPSHTSHGKYRRSSSSKSHSRLHSVHSNEKSPTTPSISATPSLLGQPSNGVPSRTGSPSKTVGPRYLELCVNVGSINRQLIELDLAGITSDGELFTAIRNKYNNMRRKSFPHNLWTRPAKLKYIKFQLEDSHRVWVIEDNPPPFSEICAGRYQYEPPSMPKEAFFHYFTKSSPYTHTRQHWIDHLPIKLHSSIRDRDPSSALNPPFSQAIMPTAWGILIEEELNHKKVFWILIIPLVIVSVGFTAIWAWCADSRTEGVTAGALFATLLAVLVVGMYKWFEQM